MKSLIKKLFVILGASTFVLVGCKRRNNAPVEEPPVEEQQNGDSSIEKIDNEPCSSYSQETLDKIKMACQCVYTDCAQESIDTVVESLLAAKFGEKLAAYSADWFVKYWTLQSKALYLSNDNVLGEDGATFKDVVYGALTIINSADVQYVPDLMSKIDEKMFGNDRTILDYKNVYYEDISYYQYKKLLQIPSASQNEDLRTLLSNCGTYFNSYHFDDASIKRFNYFQKEYRFAFAEFSINFIRKYGATMQSLLTSNLKTAVDSFASIIASFYKDFNHYYGVDAYSDNHYIDKYELDLYKTLCSNKQEVIDFCNAVLFSDDLCTFVLNGLNEYFVPCLDYLYKDNGEISTKINSLSTKFRGLSTNHLKAFCRLVVKGMEKMSGDDFAAAFSWLTSYNSDFLDDVDDYSRRNAALIKEVIAETSGTDKSLILELSSIFGFDLLKVFDDVANEFLTIESYGDERTYDIFKEAYDHIYDTFGCIFESGWVEDIYSTYHCVSQPDTTWSFNSSSILFGSTVTADDIYVNVNTWNPSYVSLNHNLGSFDVYIQNMITQYESYDSEYYAQTIAFLNTVSIDINSITSNVSRLGEGSVTLDLTLHAGGGSLRITPTLRVIVQPVVTTHYRLAFDYTNEHVYHDYDIFLYEQRSENSGTGELDLTTLGWHVQRASNSTETYIGIYVYYVVASSALEQGKTERYYPGIIFDNKPDEFYRRPEITISYKVADFFYFSYWDYVDISPEQLLNRNPGYHTTTLNNKTFEYYVISTANPYGVNYNFNLTSVFALGLESVPSAVVSVDVRTTYVYKDKTNHERLISQYDTQNATITNFSYSNKHMSFDYNGSTYKFYVSPRS